MLATHKPDMRKIKHLLDDIHSELKTLSEDIKRKRDPDIRGFRSASLPEVTISTYVPNDLYKAKRFYKLDPSWVPNDILNTRCPSYFV